MRTHSLKSRLVRLQLTLTVAVLVFSWAFIAANDYVIFRDLSINSFEATARVLARNLSACLAFQDQDECRRVLATLSDEGNVVGAAVLDTAGATIATYGKPTGPAPTDEGKRPFQYEISGGMLRASYPIFEAGELEGRLSLLMHFNMMETFGKRHALIFVSAVLGSILVGVWLSTHLQRRISEQINSILSTLDRIRQGQNYHLRVGGGPEEQRSNITEFRKLAASFDEMIAHIESRDATLQAHNQNLARLVEEKVQEAYEEKSKAIRNAELASLGEMAGGIAHEINNPLAIIKATSKSLQKMLERDRFDPATFQDSLNDVNITVDRIASIITGLRNISRRASDEERSPCRFRDIFQDVFGVAEQKFKSKGVELRRAYAEQDLDTLFSANRVQLSQVLVNLLNNAFDAIMSLDEKWIEIGIEFIPGWVRLSVTDSGGGIPEHVQEKMFNPFYTTKDVGKGTGIGLSISRSMIERNGGKFYYDRNARNTRFVVEIPLS